MIDKEWGRLRPTLDTITWRTWRDIGTDAVALGIRYVFPTEGLHGAPLETDHPNRTDIP